MRRVLRWGSTFVATLLVLLSAANCVLWVRSYRPAVNDVREMTWRGELWMIESRHGHIRVSNFPVRCSCRVRSTARRPERIQG